MCLFPRLMQNKKYLPNKKNNYNPPILEDERLKYVSVGCGQCIECRKEKAREWQVRLQEDIKVHKNARFITLTFSNDKIEDLYNIVKDIKLNDYEISNRIATVGTRRFLERWRKKFKKSVRHWFITELGEENDRIHLHGIIYTDLEKEEIEKIWGYGNIWIGEFVNEKTINYITKYVNKVDENHKGYNGKILTSRGIGANYVTSTNAERNRYRKEETKEYYVSRTGTKLSLPIYYRNKIYSEEEREKLWLEKIDKQETYVMKEKIDISTKKGIEEYHNLLEFYKGLNKRLGYGDDTTNRDVQEYNRRLRYLKHITNVKKEINKREDLDNRNI